MPVYVYQGAEYVIDTTDPEEAKQKILTHLGQGTEGGWKEKVMAFSSPFMEQAMGLNIGAKRMLGIDATGAKQQLQDLQRESEASKAENPITSIAGALTSAIPAVGAAMVNPAMAVGSLSGLGISQSEQFMNRNEMLDPSVDPVKNEQAGAIAGLAGAAGGFIPVVGKGLGTKLATGIAGNVGLGIGERATENEILSDYDKLQQNPVDPLAVGADAFFGAGGAAIAHAVDPRVASATPDIEPDVLPTSVKQQLIDENITVNNSQIEMAQKRVTQYEDSLTNRQFRTAEEAEAFKAETLEKIETQLAIVKNAEENLAFLASLKQEDVRTPTEDPSVAPRASEVPSEGSVIQPRAREVEQVVETAPEFRVKADNQAEANLVWSMLKEVGLEKENIIADTTAGLPGETRGALRVTPEKLSLLLDPDHIATKHEELKNRAEYREFFDQIPEEDQIKFTKAFVVGHEIGHALLLKTLQSKIYADDIGSLHNEYLKWLSKQEKQHAGDFGKIVPFATDDITKYDNFNEFFANRVANVLMQNKNNKALNTFVKSMKEIYNKLKQTLGFKDPGFHIDTFIKDIIDINKQEVINTGQTIWETLKLREQAANHKQPDFAEARLKGINAGMWKKRTQGSMWTPTELSTESFDTLKTSITPQIKDQKVVVQEALAAQDLTPTSGNALMDSIRSVGRGFTDHFFGVLGKKGIWSDNPVIQHVANVFLDSKRRQVSRAMELLNGKPDRAAWDNSVKTSWVSLARMQGEKSVSYLLKNTDNVDMFEVDQVIRQGYGMPYARTLEIHGKHLTPSQVEVYKAITKMFSDMHKMALETEAKLGKSNLISKVDGWYPSYRHGEYSVSLHLSGVKNLMGLGEHNELLTSTAVYNQRFFTKQEAEAFIQEFNASPEGKIFRVGTIVEEGARGDVETIQGITKAHQDNLETMGLGSAIKEAQEVLDRFSLRGGTLGKHHMFRSNIPGAMGSELFKSKEQLGDNFRKSIFSSVEDYTRQLAKMEIRHQTDAVLQDVDLTKSKPNTVESATFMRDYAVNSINGFGKSTEEVLTFKPLKRFIDSVYIDTHKYNPMKFLGAKKYPDVHVVDRIHAEVGRLFYSSVLMSRPTFLVSQGSQFLWSARSIARAGIGPVDSSVAFGKAIYQLTSHTDKEFMNALFYVSQNTNTFHAQFINALNDFHLGAFQEGKPGKMFTDWILGEKPSTMADTMSRLVSFAWMYEAHKAKGLKGEALWKKAADDTDENMVQYGRAYRAPVFKEMGMVGEMVAPLQTFAQAALGNLLSDVNLILKSEGGVQKLRASMPLMATTFVTMAMTGGLGLAGLAEYEAVRLMMNKLMEALGLETRLPSGIDYFLSGDTTADRALSHGLPAAASMAMTGGEGIDTFSSNRWQPIFGGILQGEKNFLEMLPVVNWTVDMIKNSGTIVLDSANLVPATEAERRAAALAITPGAWKGLVDMGFGSKERNATPSKYGDATTEETDMTRTAKFLGSKTIQQNVEQQRTFRTKAESQKTQQKQTNLKERLMDAVLNKDTETAQELVKKLNEIGVSPKQINTYLKTEMYRRTVPEGMRQFVGSSGKMSDTQKYKYQKYQETYGDSDGE